MNLHEVQNKRILYSCLNWGSGHVSRSIGIIRKLVLNGNLVFLYCNTEQRQIFELYNLNVTFMVGHKFEFQFKGDGNFVKEMLRNAKRFRSNIRKSKSIVEKLVQSNNIDLVLSDHDYGFVSQSTHSIFITHQVQLPPKSGFLAQLVHKKWMSKFNEIWILDNESQRLAGKLSSQCKNSTYIGWHSRFEGMEVSLEKGKVVGIVSGPAPYSEQLFKQIVAEYGHYNLVLISPKSYSKVPENVVVINDWIMGDSEISKAELVVSRNGYSTLMDLQFLNKQAKLIPTPGQLEQEYLARLT